MITETLKVTGMHCPKCTGRVEKAVGALAGVEQVSADFEADTCTIVCDGSANTLETARAAIAQEGFIVEN